MENSKKTDNPFQKSAMERSKKQTILMQSKIIATLPSVTPDFSMLPAAVIGSAGRLTFFGK